MTPELAKQHFETAQAMAEQAPVPDEEKAAMLAEIAVGLQQNPQCLEQVEYAAELFRQSIGLLADGSLQHARGQLQLAATLHTIPPVEGQDEVEMLQGVQAMTEAAIEQLRQYPAELQPDELAAAELNLGLILQTLAGMGRGSMQAAISAYQRALRDYDAKRHPAEYAIVQNNLASAYLSLHMGDQTDRIREALAVQAFEAALKVVVITDHPTEYAMLQNNLGNALQYATSGHALGNNLRALDAYDEALRVRNERDTPLPYANTLANRALCLSNLPDDPDHPELGKRVNVGKALNDYGIARRLFQQNGDLAKVPVVDEAMLALRAELVGVDLPEAEHA
jgi:tetratricopeptide (TPR) repeat protein